MSRSHRLLGLCAPILIVIAVTFANISTHSGQIGTEQENFLSQLESSAYTQSQTEVPGSYSLELDLKDLESNAGKVIYEDDAGCRVTVDQDQLTLLTTRRLP